MKKDYYGKSRRKYFVIGFLFGMVFPIIATLIRVYEVNFEYAILKFQSDPLLWIICLAPLILGATAYFVGVKQDEVITKVKQCKITENELKEANKKINKTIDELEKKNTELVKSQKSEDELHTLEKAITHFSNVIEKIGQFDLSVNPSSFDNEKLSQSQHELGEVLSIALLNLQSMVHDLTDAVKATYKAKETISESAHLISEGVDKQKTEIENTSNIIKELNEKIDKNNENAHHVAQTSTETYSKLSTLNEVVDQTSEGMSNINDAVENGSKIVQELYQSSEKIGGIVNLITEIANQTKLLALNAAIEAARAGDAGRGFAVVADEVGKLSEHTQQAVSDISESIISIQSFITQAVAKMQNGSEEVEKGMTYMMQLNSELEVLGHDLESMVKKTEELAKNNQRQYDISNTISSNIEAIEVVTNSNVSNAHQINDTVQNLDNTVSKVNQIVKQFNLRSETKEQNDIVQLMNK